MDEAVLRFIVDHRTPLLDDIALFLMRVGQSKVSFFVVIGLTVWWTLRHRAWAWGVGVSLAAVGAVLLAAVLKAIIERPRPPLESSLTEALGWSMPSSVALLCAAMGVAVVVGWRHRTGRGRALAVAVIGSLLLVFSAAVLYLGAHWATDVLAGWVLGVLVGLASLPFGRLTERLALARWPQLAPRPPD